MFGHDIMNVIDERVSSATRTAIERELFGHVIDGERIAASNGATLDVIDPSTGDVFAKAAGG